MTEEQLSSLRARLPRISKDCLAANAVAPRLSDTQPEPSHRPKPVRPHKESKRGQASLGVIITRCASRNLDRENVWGGVKCIVDALRYAGYIPDDTEDDIELFVFQKKVPRKEAGTLIEIIPL